ncbi:MAG: glycoside hydrolase family 5 protein [Clostridiales bacterium]|nr:glycoside hydrolase family 5 protein [Clostridiales bacterium]
MMKKRKLLSMLIAIMLLAVNVMAGYTTAAAESPYYGLKLHYVGENHDFIDVGIITIQGGQFSDGSWYKQLEHDKLSDVIADVQINPIDEVSISIFTSNWVQLGSCKIPRSQFVSSGGNVLAWFIEGEGIVFTNPNEGTTTTTTTMATTSATTTTQLTTSTSTTTATTTSTTAPTTITTTTSTTQSTDIPDGYYKLVINSTSNNDVGMIVIAGCQSMLSDGIPTWWHNYPVLSGDNLLTVYVNVTESVEISFLTMGWTNLADASIPASKFTSDTLNVWYVDGKISYTKPDEGQTTTSTTTTTQTTMPTTYTTTTTGKTTSPTGTTTNTTSATTSLTTEITTTTQREMNAMELVRDMKVGWNLGNSLDSKPTWFTNGTVEQYEMSWGNPVTTKAMIDMVKAAGFNTIRVPTTWEEKLGPAPNYIIREDWMNRVQEVVDYCIDNDLYVILNIHHEDWHFPSYENLESASKQMVKVWEQIAERFKDYDEKLIFEGMNEPRMMGTPLEWNGGTAEARDVINILNGVFLDTIRAAGGNNPTRFLMLPTYAASPSPVTVEAMTIPNDDRIIVSIHGYTPYNFTINTEGTPYWSVDNPQDRREVDESIDLLYRTFVSKGIPVVVGEFGASNKNNIADRAAWTEYYVRKASEVGITCVWWDNGAFTGEGQLFGILNRNELRWQYPEIVDALMRGVENYN